MRRWGFYRSIKGGFTMYLSCYIQDEDHSTWAGLTESQPVPVNGTTHKYIFDKLMPISMDDQKLFRVCYDEFVKDWVSV